MDIKKQIEAKISKALEESLCNITAKIKTNIERVVARSLGFSNKYNGDWEIDHCNGRMSTVGELVSAAARDRVEKAIRKASVKFKINAGMIKALKDEMTSRFRDEVRKHVFAKMEELAFVQADQIVAEMIPDFSQISIDIKSMTNPEYGNREIEKVAMEARAIVDGEVEE